MEKIIEMKTIISIIILTVTFVSCEIKPQPIDYGNESCAYCNMAIVHKQFASQIVNDKGRAYSFDAIECMINYHNEHKDQPVALFLATDFKSPGELMDATDATFLITEQIPSPMGANLCGFKTRADAETTQKEFGGKLYNWRQLLGFFKTS